MEPAPSFGGPQPVGSLDPLPEPQPAPKEDPCGECAKQRKKDKKKRKPREVCWKGTFIEKATGQTKIRRTRVSCATGQPLK